MEKNSARSQEFSRPPDNAKIPRPSDIPETQTSILQKAAAGEWEEFLAYYMEPCWQQIVIICRSRGIPLTDADDLFQELCIRLIRDGRLQYRGQESADCGENEMKIGNIPARFLMARALPMDSPRFRTYLQGVIRNVVRESLVRRARSPCPITQLHDAPLEPWLDESISRSIDRQWIVDCLDRAALELLRDSRQATTKGKRRIFDILYWELVEGQSQKKIAELLGIDQGTASTTRKVARLRFVQVLQEITQVEDLAELRQAVSGSTEALRAAFQRARQILTED